MSETRSRGRPAGQVLPNVKNLRLSDRDMERLRRLAEKLEISASEAVRRAIRELADREKVG